ncbi:hypothetical protein [Actinocrispum sp. NPDC049592]|uniref:hypothetical protein n=1 Tax=Actinocrispum sp. NPDC049592 TaxID=3154835 RepID=UPI0034384E3F
MPSTEFDDGYPAHRPITVYVTGGLREALRVAMLLHSRNYRVRALSLDIREGVVESTVKCTVSLTMAETALLLARLRRLPSVVSAENCLLV